MPCVAEFGIMDSIDRNKDYIEYEAKKYNCVAIDDDALDGWWEKLTTMKTYFHSYNRPETALARYGITLIPPESLDLLYDIVSNHTNPDFIEQTHSLLTMIFKAKADNKFIIHFGV